VTIRINKEKRIPKNGNSFAEKCPEKLEWWNVEKNEGLTAYDVRYGCKDKYWFTCPVGHDFCASASNVRRYKVCPICAGQVLEGYNDLKTTHPKLAKEVSKNSKYKSTEVTFGSHKKVIWHCQNCGHEWIAQIKSRTISKRGCPKCHRSKPERDISIILDKHNIPYEIQKKFQQNKHLKNMPFDFWLPQWNLVIEYNGRLHYNKAIFDRITGNTTRKIKPSFSSRINIDKIKRDFCHRNNIRLLVIPYTYNDHLTEIIEAIVANPDELPILEIPPIQYADD
jgi:hypothetical protein